MAPFGGEPRVVEIEPADHRADVERRHHGVQLELGARHLCAVRNDRATHDWPEQLLACRIFERLEPAAERVHQAVAGGVDRFLALDLVIQHVVRDVNQYLVGLRADVADVAPHDAMVLS